MTLPKAILEALDAVNYAGPQPPTAIFALVRKNVIPNPSLSAVEAALTQLEADHEVIEVGTRHSGKLYNLTPKGTAAARE